MHMHPDPDLDTDLDWPGPAHAHAHAHARVHARNPHNTTQHCAAPHITGQGDRATDGKTMQGYMCERKIQKRMCVHVGAPFTAPKPNYAVLIDTKTFP